MRRHPRQLDTPEVVGRPMQMDAVTQGAAAIGRTVCVCDVIQIATTMPV